MKTIPASALLADTRFDLRLTLIAGEEGLDRQVVSPRVQKPGLALAGYLDHLHPDRVQVFGNTEMSYLATLPAARQVEVLTGLFQARVPCLVVTKNLPIPEVLSDAAGRAGVPLLKTSLLSSLFIDRSQAMLEESLKARATLHGVLIDVYGIGVLLMGHSGIGKSECALDLVMRGHRLVADDVVEVERRQDQVYGAHSLALQHHIEIRGLGIINIRDLFGIASVRDAKLIELVCHLVEWQADEEYDRLGIDEQRYSILDIPVPMRIIPVRPGRNITTIIEVAARNQLLKVMGHHSAQAFQRSLSDAIARAEPLHVPREEPE